VSLRAGKSQSEDCKTNPISAPLLADPTDSIKSLGSFVPFSGATPRHQLQRAASGMEIGWRIPAGSQSRIAKRTQFRFLYLRIPLIPLNPWVRLSRFPARRNATNCNAPHRRMEIGGGSPPGRKAKLQSEPNSGSFTAYPTDSIERLGLFVPFSGAPPPRFSGVQWPDKIPSLQPFPRMPKADLP
jgi:hypothetical protein